MKTFLLFVATALAEIVGCYLPYLWLKQGRSIWLLVPAAASLALFAWLLTWHGPPQDASTPHTAASISAWHSRGCGRLTRFSRRRGTWLESLVALSGMGIIMFQPAR